MRKIIYSALSAFLCLILFAGCGGNTTDTSSKAPETGITVIDESKIPEVVPEGNTALLYDGQHSDYDEKAEKKRQEILNTEDIMPSSGVTYYISPDGDDSNDGKSPETAWKTTNALNTNSWAFMAGDTVLFERGGIYRTSSAIFVKSGMNYGAYGEGDKPVLYGSAKNYAQPGLWKPSNKKNVWKMDFSLEDVGIIVFDHGKDVGTKKTGLMTLTKNGDFYHNTEDRVLYLYYDKGRPNKEYRDIEIGVKRAIFSLTSGVSNVMIDNICMKYAGTFGVQCIGDNNGITVQNCEIGWIGGSTLSGTSRYGNAVQFWDSCKDANITNNWIYQIYDTGITFQGSVGSIYDNIRFSDNLIEYTAYALEFFIQGEEYISKKDGSISNIYFENNMLRFTGYGWTKQRFNISDVGAIVAWTHVYEDMSNFNIKNNIFDCTARNFVYWLWDGEHQQNGLNISGNSFYQKANEANEGMKYADNGIMSITDQKSLEDAVKTFDKSPGEVKWLD